jgi:hypothetical protein
MDTALFIDDFRRRLSSQNDLNVSQDGETLLVGVTCIGKGGISWVETFKLDVNKVEQESDEGVEQARDEASEEQGVSAQTIVESRQKGQDNPETHPNTEGLDDDTKNDDTVRDTKGPETRPDGRRVLQRLGRPVQQQHPPAAGVDRQSVHRPRDGAREDVQAKQDEFRCDGRH